MYMKVKKSFKYHEISYNKEMSSIGYAIKKRVDFKGNYCVSCCASIQISHSRTILPNSTLYKTTENAT